MSSEADVPGSLWRHRDFLCLWAGQTVSDLGSAVTLLALPLVAITTLGASTFQVGVLSALSTIGWLIVPLPAGVIVDRLPKRRLMIRCDLGRAIIVASIPLAAAAGALRLGQLYLAAFLLGVLTVFFEVAWQSHTPSILRPDELTTGISRIAATNALSAVAGPSLTGGLVALLGNVTRVLIVDFVSFVISAVSLILVRAPDPGGQRRPSWDITEGLRFVLRHPILRRVVACSATSNMFDAMMATLVIVFLVSELETPLTAIGVIMGIGGLGGVIGGAITGPMSRRLGAARLLWLGKASLGWLVLLIPLAQPGWAVTIVSIGLFANSFSLVMYNILQISYRQLACPPTLLGRMNASVRWLIRGLMPVGALLGGVLGAAIGLRWAISIAACGSWLAVLWIVCSPLRRIRDMPTTLPGQQGAC